MSIGASQMPLAGQTPLSQAFPRFWPGQKQLSGADAATQSPVPVWVTVPVESGLMSIASSPTLLPVGKQSFDVEPNCGLVPPASHGAPTVAVPPAQVPPFWPSFGVGSPFIIAVITFVLGAVLLVWCMRKYPGFFRRRPEVVDPASLAHAPAGASSS